MAYQKKTATAPPAESAMKTELSSTPTPSPSEGTVDVQPEKPTKLTVPHSVQFMQPTEVKPISPGSSYQQVSKNQCSIVVLKDGIVLGPHDPRNKFTLMVPWSAVKGVTYEEIDATKPV